jgi:mRNA interferase MazF
VAGVLRGEIHWADLEPVVGSEQSGLRPVVIISDSVFNAHSNTVIAIAITSREPRVGFPLALELTTAKLPKRSWAKIGQIRTLAVQRLRGKVAHVAPEELDRIVEGLNDIVGR